MTCGATVSGDETVPVWVWWQEVPKSDTHDAVQFMCRVRNVDAFRQVPRASVVRATGPARSRNPR